MSLTAKDLARISRMLANQRVISEALARTMKSAPAYLAPDLSLAAQAMLQQSVEISSMLLEANFPVQEEVNMLRDLAAKMDEVVQGEHIGD